jgi:hypothetical protein
MSSRCLGGDYLVVLNYGGWFGSQILAEMNLPDRMGRELWNSAWPAFGVEGEGSTATAAAMRGCSVAGDRRLRTLA